MTDDLDPPSDGQVEGDDPGVDELERDDLAETVDGEPPAEDATEDG